MAKVKAEKEEKKKEKYKTNPKYTVVGGIMCGECGKHLFAFVVYYKSDEEDYQINKVALLDVICPNCGAKFEEIPLS